MTKKEWEKFKDGFSEPRVKRRLILLIVLVVLFVINLIWFQYDRDQRQKEMENYISTVHTQGVLGGFP